jgi:non-ribosomal peptide synthase protein (TIGR01720 family)
VRLPDKTTSFKHWAERLERAAQDPAWRDEAAFWLRLPWQHIAPLPVDDPLGERAEAVMAELTVELSAEHTRALLEEVAEAYRARVDEILITAVALAVSRWTGQRAAALDIEGHGRDGLQDEEIDLSRTIGWFTTVYPLVLELSPEMAEAAALVSVKEQLRRLPRRGLAYGVVRELGTDAVAEQLRNLPSARVGFNYLGQWDQALAADGGLALVADSAGREHDPRSPLAYELEIDAAVYGGRLEATWRYSARRYRSETVERVARLFKDALELLIASGSLPEADLYTPSDFPDVALSRDELKTVLEQLD